MMVDSYFLCTLKNYFIILVIVECCKKTSCCSHYVYLFTEPLCHPVHVQSYGPLREMYVAVCTLFVKDPVSDRLHINSYSLTAFCCMWRRGVICHPSSSCPACGATWWLSCWLAVLPDRHQWFLKVSRKAKQKFEVTSVVDSGCHP